MSSLTKLMAGLMIAGTSVSMAAVTLDFANVHPARDFSASGDSITLDFSIDGAGAVSMQATPVGSATNVHYLAAVTNWSGPVGTVADASLFGQSFQVTLFVTLVDRVTGDPAGTERLSVDGRYDDGIMGVGGGNGSRVDWTSGPQEFLHFAQTGGSAEIGLLEFEYHGASTTANLWDTQLIAGSVSNRWDNLPGTSGSVDVSGLGYIIGSGAQDLTFSMPLDASHGIGLAGMTLEILASSILASNRLAYTFDRGTGDLTLSWSGAGQLQVAGDLTSPVVWTNVPGVVGMSHVVATGGGPQRAYYRLKSGGTNGGFYEIVPSGTSDDTDLIQDALDALQAGDTLQLTGDFFIADTIYLPSNFKWVLEGTLSLANNADDDLDSVGWYEELNDANNNVIDARRRTGITEQPGGAVNIEMSGGTYSGNSAGNPASLRFINFVSVTNSFFHDMLITDVSDDNFTLGPGSNGNVCSNLVGSFAGGNALTDKGDHNRWYDCIAEDCASDGWTPKCRNSEFYRCVARRNAGPGFGMYCRIDGSGNPDDLGETIAGNRFYDCLAHDNDREGFSFDISSTSGEGGSVRNNSVQGMAYNNRMQGVFFRNKQPNSIIESNQVDIVAWGNLGQRTDGSPSTLAGGLSVEGSVTSPVRVITGYVVCYDNVGWDVNTYQATDCNITAYHPAGEDAPVLKTGDASNIITVIDFDCSDPLVQWCMQAYCDSFSP